ncbi:MAG: hypothetical protein HRT63_06735 [Erythrobacter sp.]|nr:hypothetical protein [Erythrobacter sp.]
MEKQRLRSRLSSYWKMELGNVLILPAAMVFLCILYEQSLSWWLALAISVSPRPKNMAAKMAQTSGWR